MEQTLKPISKRKLTDGTYNNKPSDPAYFIKYYHAQGSTMTTCYQCGCECRKNYLNKHTKTSKCKNEMQKRSEHLASLGLMPNFDV